MGANGLVLAAETAIGKHPKNSVNGIISTCGVLTAAEDEIVVRKAITAIIHP